MSTVIKIDGLEEVKAILNQIEKDALPAALEAVKAGGLIVEQEGVLNINKQGLRGRTGHLINSYHIWEYGIDEKSGSAYVDVGSRGVIYARIHEFGGTILPKRVKFLHFYLDPRTATRHFVNEPPGEGDEIFTKRVVMPARPYHRPAIDENKSKILQAMKASAERSLMKTQAGNG